MDYMTWQALTACPYVWDPFCGTGSILVGAAHFGAHVMGSDIDIRVIKHGKTDKKTGEPVDVWTNFSVGLSEWCSLRHPPHCRVCVTSSSTLHSDCHAIHHITE